MNEPEVKATMKMDDLKGMELIWYRKEEGGQEFEAFLDRDEENGIGTIVDNRGDAIEAPIFEWGFNGETDMQWVPYKVEGKEVKDVWVLVQWNGDDGYNELAMINKKTVGRPPSVPQDGKTFDSYWLQFPDVIFPGNIDDVDPHTFPMGWNTLEEAKESGLRYIEKTKEGATFICYECGEEVNRAEMVATRAIIEAMALSAEISDLIASMMVGFEEIHCEGLDTMFDEMYAPVKCLECVLDVIREGLNQ